MQKNILLLRNLFLLILFGVKLLQGQQLNVKGLVVSNGEPVSFVRIDFINSDKQLFYTNTDEEGRFEIELLPDTYRINVSALGLKVKEKTLTINQNSSSITIELEDDLLGLDEVIISATRNRVNKKEAPIIVNTLGEKIINATQALAVSETLNFSPGVRVETNCQNCGFTQVRLNGLDGSYSQILVNSRAVFSPLNSVYGLEQIPSQIVERVEIVRSGGSALYGSNAIAGTINIITKDPVLNSWEVGSYLGFVDGDVPDRTINFNTSFVAENLNSGATFFGMYRNRDAWDANNDGFTEMTKLNNTTFGTKVFYKPTDQSRLSLDATVINEYRRGGDRLELAPHLTDITEETTHNTFLGGLSYDFSNDDNTNNYSFYSSVQYTNRDSFYGGLGGGRTAQDSLLALNAYGITKDFAMANGFQFTKQFKKDVLTTGIEYNINNIEDEIAGYNRVIDQSVNNFGIYAQYEWKPNSKFSALMGARIDVVDVDGFYKVGTIESNSNISQTAFNPRLTIAYQITDDLKFRGGYARGFRAPQAFNEDLHISSVGGEPQFVILSNNLDPEFSNAFTGSLNYSKNFNTTQTNFLIEGFYTALENPFTIVNTGDQFPNGSILEEVRNGQGASVFGTNIEIGVSPSKKWLFQLGGTIQQSEYNDPQILFEADGTNPNESDILIDEFVRNPNVYGYLNTNWTPNDTYSFSLTGTYTGSMTVPLVISNSGFLSLNQSPSFFDLNLKAEANYDLSEAFQITLSAGVKNMFNSIQDDFQIGAERDSDYVYGPAFPRTLFFGEIIGDL